MLGKRPLQHERNGQSRVSLVCPDAERLGEDPLSGASATPLPALWPLPKLLCSHSADSTSRGVSDSLTTVPVDPVLRKARCAHSCV